MAGAANPAMTMNPFQGAAQATMASRASFCKSKCKSIYEPI